MQFDRGLHNRGIFHKTIAKKGIHVRQAALESSEQIGRVERRSDVLEKMITKVVKETNATGEAEMDMVITECISAISEMSRHGGFAPAQWVLSRLPRVPASQGDEAEFADIGAIQAHVDGPTEFGLQSRYRLKAREAFIKWDIGERMQKAILR